MRSPKYSWCVLVNSALPCDDDQATKDHGHECPFFEGNKHRFKDVQSLPEAQLRESLQLVGAGEEPIPRLVAIAWVPQFLRVHRFVSPEGADYPAFLLLNYHIISINLRYMMTNYYSYLYILICIPVRPLGQRWGAYCNICSYTCFY